MRLLLDTHALYRFSRGDPGLPNGARTAIEHPDSEILISAASLWEMALKHAAGRWDGAGDVPSNLDDIMRRSGFHELPITVAHARSAASLQGPHKDPFDRVLIARAILEDATIVSADRVFQAYSVPVLWS